MAHPAKAADTEYTEHTITEVERTISITTDQGPLYLGDAKNLPLEPKVGDTARFYGRGVGFPVRGIDINGVEIRYQTDEESRSAQEKELARYQESLHERAEQARTEGKMPLSEELDGNILKEWTAVAEGMKLEDLPEFLRHLTEDYYHDYGTICHAIAIGAYATAQAIERSPAGGITGFQAGAVMWGFVKHWMSIKGPTRLVQYEDLLFPQYAEKFQTISSDTWKWVQEQAQQRLADAPDYTSPSVVAHQQSIVAGFVPFGLRVQD